MTPRGQPTLALRTNKTAYAIAAVLVTLFVVAIVTPQPERSQRGSVTPPAPPLDVTAAKGLLGLSLTNRESVPLFNCEVTVLERGRPDEWTAIVGVSIQPLETRDIDWSEFGTQAGRMPRYVGTNAKYFTLSCLVSGTRRSAGFSF